MTSCEKNVSTIIVHVDIMDINQIPDRSYHCVNKEMHTEQRKYSQEVIWWSIKACHCLTRDN